MTSKETLLPNQWGSPALFLAAAETLTTTATREQFPLYNEWKSPSLFLAAAASSQQVLSNRPSPISYTNRATFRTLSTPYTQATFRSLCTPSANNEGPFALRELMSPKLYLGTTPSPWQANASAGFRTLHSTLHLGRNFDHPPILFSPICDAAMVGQAQSVNLKDTADEASGPENIPPLAKHANQNGTETTYCFFDNDVILGKGNKPRQANKEFNRLVTLHAIDFAGKTKEEKPFVIHRIVRSVQDRGGRFLEKSAADGKYRVLDNFDDTYKKVHMVLQHAAKKSLSKKKKRPPIAAQVARKKDGIPINENAIPQPDVPPKSSDYPHTSREKQAARVHGNAGVDESGCGTASSSRLKKKRVAVVDGFHRKSKRSKQELQATCKTGETVPKPTTSVAPERLNGVRVAVTKKGTFEARFKPLGKGKTNFPQYICTVSDRGTATSIGNFVAQSLQQNPEMTFAMAKQEAVRQFKPQKSKAKKATVRGQAVHTHDIVDLADQVVKEILDQDKNWDVGANSENPEDMPFAFSARTLHDSPENETTV